MVQLSRGYRLAAIGLVAGAAIGLLIRQAPGGDLWLAAMLGLSAALVALAQQTLP
ncbi:MAG: hypothetical protein ACR2LS_07815 [Thermomicrobiales bacterium]